MTEDRGESKRVLQAEALLARAPLREPDWDAFASRIEAALTTAGTTDDSLLLPPLPESVEDGRLEVARAAVEAAAPAGTNAVDEEAASARESTSLAELARAAIARRGAKDAVSLAKESLAIASQKRGPVEVAAQPTPAPERRGLAAPAVLAEPSIVVERERRTVPPSRRARPALDTRGPWIGVAVAAVGLAAGFGLYLSGRARTEIVEVPVAAAPATPAPPARATAVAKGLATAEHVPPAAPMTPDMLPAERPAPPPAPTAIAAEAVAADVAPAKPSVARVASAETRTPGAPSSGSVRAEKVVLEDEHPATAAASAAASRPGTTPGLKPAELNANGGVADRPSTGAAQAAVGAVLGAARSCLAGQPQGSSATLVFGSNGEVTNVSVSGPAEGTPAASCIQSALKRARVQPFAAPSFSLGVTVRPP